MKNRISGFSLLEMSIVILISGIIMTAVLNTIPIIYRTTKSLSNNKKLEKVEDAFYAFILKHKRLPIPANMEDKINTNTGTYGLEQNAENAKKVNSNENLYIGTLPSVDLGLSPEYVYDEYGNKFVYIVNANCTKTKGLLKCDSNSNDLITMETNDITTKNIVFSIVAQGANKRYSYATNSSTQSTPKNTSRLELFNSYDFFKGTVYNKIYSSQNFDDTVIYGTKEFILTKLDMYDIGCVVNMNNASTINNILNACVGSPNFSTTGEKFLDYREKYKSYEYEYNEKTYTCTIECGSYGQLNFYSHTDD